MNAKNTVTQQDIDNLLNKAEWDMKTIFGKCTVVTCKLPNSFILVESSACVDPANYDHQIGEHICRERIKNKLWELEGYRLQCMLAATKNSEKREVCAREVMEQAIDHILQSETRLVFNELLAFIKGNKNFTREELIWFLRERGDFLRKNPDMLPSYYKHDSAEQAATAKAAAKEAIREIKKEPVNGCSPAAGPRPEPEPVPVPTHLDGAGFPVKQLKLCRYTNPAGSKQTVLALALLSKDMVRVLDTRSLNPKDMYVPFVGLEINPVKTVPSRHLLVMCDFHPDHLAPISEKKE